jgi:hypothetical protein
VVSLLCLCSVLLTLSCSLVYLQYLRLLSSLALSLSSSFSISSPPPPCVVCVSAYASVLACVRAYVRAACVRADVDVELKEILKRGCRGEQGARAQADMLC